MGEQIDVVAANNDEMAIGAIFALQQAGQDPRNTASAASTARPMPSTR